MPENEDIRCSFCGKSNVDTKHMIAGQDVNICNECVENCNRIITKKESSEKKCKLFDHKCTYCGKHQDDVLILIAAPGEKSYICDECIDECIVIVEFQRADKSRLMQPQADCSPAGEMSMPSRCAQIKTKAQISLDEIVASLIDQKPTSATKLNVSLLSVVGQAVLIELAKVQDERGLLIRGLERKIDSISVRRDALVGEQSSLNKLISLIDKQITKQERGQEGGKA